MNSKQRVHAALRREPVDRVPIFMWFHPETRALLAELFEVPPASVDFVLGNDVRMTWVNNNHAMEGIVHQRDGQGHVDFWGIEWVKEGPYNQIARFPLQEASPEAVRRYQFPDDHMEELLALMEPVVVEADEYFIGCDVSPNVFEMYWRLRGMEQALLDMAADPDLAGEMFARCGEFAARLAEEACRRFPLDWLWTGDDVADQRSMMMSPDTWRRLVKPHLGRCFEVGKAHGLPVAYHCCGTPRPILGDLVEMGLDILNPVQCNCPGMDPIELKREFGDRLTFMGGVDTQDLLPNATADEVRRATRRLIDGMTSDGGGYILAASHTIPPETPVDNIFAMYAEAGISRQEAFDRAADLRAARKAAGADT
ncbi:MAG: uroporphyrinogen decarboxylase family protein [Planctomycetota bacterium]